MDTERDGSWCLETFFRRREDKRRRAGGVEEANSASTEQLHIVSIVQSRINLIAFTNKPDSARDGQ